MLACILLGGGVDRDCEIEFTRDCKRLRESCADFIFACSGGTRASSTLISGKTLLHSLHCQPPSPSTISIPNSIGLGCFFEVLLILVLAFLLLLIFQVLLSLLLLCGGFVCVFWFKFDKKA